MRTEEPITEQQLGEAERKLLQGVARAWSRGWQPRELARYVRRTSDAVAAKLVLLAIAADHANRPATTLDARWIAQLDELELPKIPRTDGWLEGWWRDNQFGGQAVAPSLVFLQIALDRVIPMPVLIPPPGAPAGGEPTINLTVRTDDPILNRVRALLAQAESTNFEAEAATFTAKAQELMTRHAIDMAMVAVGSVRAERPDTIRIPIDEPYINAKWTLLNIVAENSRCRAVFAKHVALASIIGFDADLQAAETLFTSLLVQAQVALRAATAAAPPGSPERTRTFRSSFLLAYAYRVGERLEAINAHVVAEAEAETGRSVLPVLAARSSIVDTRVRELFPRLGTMRSRATVDPDGWASGRMAADRAKLNAGDLARSTPALPHANASAR